MFRSFTATVAAVAIACAGFAATPATADDNDLLELLAGAAVVGIIAHAYNKDRKRREQHAAPPTAPAPLPAPAPIISYTLPAQCITTLRTERGWQAFYFKNCTDGIMRRGLPGECLTEVRTDTGSRLAYAEPCLLERGYRIENGWR